VYFQRFIKFGLVFLLLSFALTYLSASSETEVNATYIYLPKIPLIEAVTPVPIVAKKAVKALPVITVVPKVEKKKERIDTKSKIKIKEN
jgi:hypothetical protein